MCTQPLKILNPSKWLSPTAGQQLYLRVPCGHCIECRQRLQNEWRIRTYYECLDTIRTGGYVLFDTLTYASEWLPRLSDFMMVPHELDFPCFSRKHLQDFLKRLRTYLSREIKDKQTHKVIKPSYPAANNLRFFVTSEYGTSERGTKRPHYHIFFFVCGNSIPPFVLSYAVSKCWSYGRTDGLPFKTRSYVRDHNTFDSLDLAAKRCLLYVSKYVAKDFIYSDMVVSRLEKLKQFYYGDANGNPIMTKDQKKHFDWIKRFVLPFHSQSLNFGSLYIEEQGVDNIIERGTLVFNVNGLPSTFALFPSLKRKLFYNRRKNDLGDTVWYLNNRGILFKQKQFEKNVRNLQQSIDEYNFVHDVKISFSPEYFLLNQDRLQSSPISSDGYLKQLVTSSSVYEFNGLRNYSSIDRDFIHKSVLSKIDFGSRKHGFSMLLRLIQVKRCDGMQSNDIISLEDFSRYALHDDKVESDYQKLLDWLAINGKKKLKTQKLLEKNKKILKSLNLC